VTTAVVFGYGDVGIRCLATLLAQGVTVPLVVTHPDDPTEALWYGSLARFAQERDIPVYLSANADDDELFEQVVALKPDLLFSFYYRRMLPQRLLAVPRQGAYNLHGSLLPQFRGRAPVNWVCVHGATQTGASLHVMTAKPDAGALVDQMAVPVLPDDTAQDVFRKVCTAAELVLSRSLPALRAGTSVLTPLDLAAGSYFGARRPEDGQINWSWPAVQIHNLVRAVAPPFPPARAQFAGQTLFVHRSLCVAVAPPAGLAAPAMFAQGERIYALCGDGGVLRLLEGRWGAAEQPLAALLPLLADGPLLLAAAAAAP
jgi:methionyl-tRNA formyltransferase